MSYSPNLAKYDPRFMTYNLNEASLAKFRAAWAKQRNNEAPAHILCIGDSITAGSTGVTGNLHTNSWPGRLRAALDTKTGVPVGTGVVETQMALTAQSGQPVAVGSGSGNYPYAAGTALAGFGAGGLNGIAYTNSAGGTATFGFQTLGANAIIKVWLFNYQGNFASTSVTVDGGGVAAITKGATASGALFSASYTVASAGNHTIVLTSTAGMYVVGFEVIENVTSGVKVTNAGVAGRTTGGVSTLAACAAAYAPDLTLILLTTNDMIQGGTGGAGTASTNIQAAITAAKTTGDCVLIVPPTDGSSGTSTTLMNTYRTALYALADSSNIAAIDLNKRLLAYSTGLLNDGIGHLTNRGAWDFGGAVAGLIAQAVLI